MRPTWLSPVLVAFVFTPILCLAQGYVTAQGGEMAIYCDICLTEKGVESQMEGPHSMLFRSGARSEKGDVVYSCGRGAGLHSKNT